MNEQREWLRFLHSFALSDHLGDASEAVRDYAKKCGLPIPDDGIMLEEWLDFCVQRGVEEGIHG